MNLLNLINNKVFKAMSDTTTQIKSESRVTSFSVKPEDIDAQDEIAKLKAHADRTGVNFSFYVIRAIKKLNAELELNDNPKA